MDFLGWGEPAFFLALLTQGVFGDIAGAIFAPLASITFINLWVALVLAIVVLSEFGVLITVPAVREARASGMRAGRFRLARHRVPPRGNGKAPRGILSARGFNLFLTTYSVPDLNRVCCPRFVQLVRIQRLLSALPKHPQRFV